MSDENTPKFRLRPKLAGGPAAITPAANSAPAAETPPPVPVPPAAAAEVAKPALRAKLALKAEEAVPSPDGASVAPTPPAAQPGPYLHDPRAFPPPPAKPLQVSARAKPTLAPSPAESSPSDTGAVPPFPMPAIKDKLPAVLKAPPPPRPSSAPVAQETWPAVLNAPPPPGLAPTIAPGGKDDEPAEITAIRKASTFPFPSPTAKFPPLPGLDTAGDTAPQAPAEQESFLKKLLLFGALAVLLLIAAGAFAYFKFFAKPAPKPAIAPEKIVQSPPPAKAPAPEVKQPTEAPAPTKAVVVTTPVPVPAEVIAEPTAPMPEPGSPAAAAVSPAPASIPQPEVAPVAPAPVIKPPPPQPSLAFKAWVINLKIRGVRGGDAQRVFIEKTSYVPGDMVNTQLGIIFTGYDESTRMLTFQDKTGAVFERRH